MAAFFLWCILFIICWASGSTGHRTISDRLADYAAVSHPRHRRAWRFLPCSRQFCFSQCEFCVAHEQSDRPCNLHGVTWELKPLAGPF